LNNVGIENIDAMIVDYISLTKKNNYFSIKRNDQNKYWLLATIEQQLKNDFYQNLTIKKALSEEISNLENGKTTPFNAAKRLLNL
jgi:LAO/AO transport system kinase